MKAQIFYVVVYYPKHKQFVCHEITSLSVVELYNLFFLACHPWFVFVCVFDDKTKFMNFTQLFNRIRIHFFGSKVKRTANALQKHINGDALDLPAFVQSLLAMPMEADREAAFEKYVKDVWQSVCRFVVNLARPK